MFIRISKLCSEKGITVTELEKILGFGNSTIIKWKKSNPTVEKLKKVADYFGVSVDSLLEDKI